MNSILRSTLKCMKKLQSLVNKKNVVQLINKN